MNQYELHQRLSLVARGQLAPEEAAVQLRRAPFDELGFAKPDHHRALRQGVGEVIYGAGKTPQQIADIARSLQENGAAAVLITRMSQEAAEFAAQSLTLDNDTVSRTGIVGKIPSPDGIGTAAPPISR